MLHLLKKAEKLLLSPKKRDMTFSTRFLMTQQKALVTLFSFRAVFAPRQNASLSIRGFDVG